MITGTTTSPLDDAAKEATGAALNRVLADLVDLSLVGKQGERAHVRATPGQHGSG